MYYRGRDTVLTHRGTPIRRRLQRDPRSAAPPGEVPGARGRTRDVVAFVQSLKKMGVGAAAALRPTASFSGASFTMFGRAAPPCTRARRRRTCPMQPGFGRWLRCGDTRSSRCWERSSPLVEVTERGLLGDRAYALVDSADGKAATAKNPRKWPTLFGFRATFIEPPRPGRVVPPVRITLPDGTTATSQQADLNQLLSRALGRTVTLNAAGRGHAGAVNAEEYWPDMEGLDHRDTVTDFALPEGTFFDCATVHLLTTATLDRLHQLYPQGRFEVPRFRPNIVVAPASGEKDFVENAWVGHTLAIGDVCSPERHRSLRPLCHDDPGPRGPATGSGHLAHRGPTQQGQRRRLRDSRARRHDPSR